MDPRKNRVRNPSFEVSAARWAGSMATLARVAGAAPAGGSWCGRLTQSSLGVHGGEGTEVRRNLTPNPSFESPSLSAWSLYRAWFSTSGSDEAAPVADPALARVSVAAPAGAGQYAARVTSADPQTDYLGLASAFGSQVPVAPGATYTLSAYAMGQRTTNRRLYARVEWYGDGGAFVDQRETSAAVATAGAWQRFSVSAACPTGAEQARLVLYYGRASSEPGFGLDVGEAVYFDAVLFEQSASLGDYFDGSTQPPAGYHNEWVDGTADASASVQRLNEAVATYADDDLKLWREGANAYALSAYVRAPAGSPARSAYARVRWLDGGGDTRETFAGPPVATVPGSWVRVSAAGAPQYLGTALLDVVVEGMALGESHDVDAVLFERATGVGPYFDGDTPDAPFLTYGPGQLASGLARAWLTAGGSRAPHDAQSVEADALGFDLTTHTHRVGDGGWNAVMDGVAGRYFE